MKLKFVLLISWLQISFIQAQNFEKVQTDSIVSIAISLSEKALYNARFEESKEIVALSYFKNFKFFNGLHEILLTIQAIRVEGFMNIVYHKKTDHRVNLGRLNGLLPHATEIEDMEVLGTYYLALSNAFWQIDEVDTATIYQEKALSLLQKEENLKKIAEIRAFDISRKHNQLFSQGNKEEILELIPKYEREIEFSTLYSKYALAYNTRHLGQIHRRQTLDYKKALPLFQESLDLRLEIGFKPFIPASYSSLGDVYMKMGEYLLAIEMYTKSWEVAQEIGFVRYESYPRIMIGDIYLIQGQGEKALEYYAKALKVASENQYQVGMDQAIERIEEIGKKH